MSENSFGFSAGQRTTDLARQKAVESCKHDGKNKEPCKVVFADHEEVHP
jgi:hypothetical protein